MKTIYSILIFVTVCVSTMAQTNVLFVDVADYGLAPQGKVNCTLTLLSPLNRTVNGIAPRNDPMGRTSNTNGRAYWTNIVWGKYRLDVAGFNGTQYTLYVGTNTLGLWNMAALITNSAAIPPNSATNFLTEAQTLALIAGIEGGSVTLPNSATNSATNVTVTASGSVTASATMANNVAAITVGAPALWPLSAITNGSGLLTNNHTATVNFADNLYIGGFGGLFNAFVNSGLINISGNRILLNEGNGDGNFAGLVSAGDGFAGDGSQLTGVVHDGDSGVTLSGTFIGNGAGLTGINAGISNGSSGVNLGFIGFTSYKTNSWANIASLTVTGCVQFPFINGTNAYKPWSGSRSIYVNTNIAATNVFLFYEARNIHDIMPGWAFAGRPAFTNASTAIGLYEYNFLNTQTLPIGQNAYWTWDDSSQDTTTIIVSEYALETNAVVNADGALSLQYGDYLGAQDYNYLSFSNMALGLPLMTMGGGGSMAGQIGNLVLFGIPYGQYVTNNQINEAGFEAGKINYTATYNVKDDKRAALDLAVYFNTDASAGSQIETMVQMPTYYGTANNGAGSWSRNFVRHWKGIWAGDLRVSEHVFNVIPPARLTVVASTNDIPFFTMTNQQPSGNKQFNGRLPAGSEWTDNTNFFIGGSLCIATNAGTFNPIDGQVKFAISNNWLFVVTRFATNPLVKIHP